MKKLLFTVVMLMLLFNLSIYAQGHGTPGLKFIDIPWLFGYGVSIGTATCTDIVIPPRHRMRPVVWIYEHGFAGSNITSISLPNTIRGIDYRAFAESSLPSIQIPSTVTEINREAFAFSSLSNIEFSDGLLFIETEAFCSTKLTSVSLPSTVTFIGDVAFRNTPLTEVFISSSLTWVGTNPFIGCTDLVSIIVDDENQHFRSEGNNLIRNSDNTLISSSRNSIIPEGVVNIGRWAFAGRRELTYITIPNSVKNIGNNAFSGCVNLSNITFGDSVSVIGERAFGNTGFVSIEIPNSVTRIGIAAFERCTSLEKVILPSNLPVIHGDLFSDCTSLIEIEIPNSVYFIDGRAFWNCVSLEKIVIPASVLVIGSSAFGFCNRLTIYAETESQPQGWVYGWNMHHRPVIWGYVVSDDDTVESPFTTTLLGNYPNPFNPFTSIRYQVSGIRSHVQINIYNVRGQRIRTLINEHHEPGKHDVVWNGADDSGQQVGSGVYFYQMSIRDGMNTVYTVDTRKMMLIK